jgi:hypothetical protein
LQVSVVYINPEKNYLDLEITKMVDALEIFQRKTEDFLA